MSDIMFLKNACIYDDEMEDTAEVQELQEATESLELFRNKYLKLKKLKNAIELCVESDILDNELKMKVRNILFGEECAKYLHIESDGFSQEATTLLGLPVFEQIDLTFKERENLNKAIEATLIEENKNLNLNFFELTKKKVEDLPRNNFLNLDIKQEDKVVLDLQQQLSNHQNTYLQNLLTHQSLLEKFVKLRLETLPETIELKLKEAETITRMNHLRTSILETKSRIDIFNETKNTLPAYKQILDNIKLQEIECKRDIQDLEELKEQYKLVDCNQFQSLLKTYIQYQSAIEKKKIIYSCMQNN